VFTVDRSTKEEPCYAPVARHGYPQHVTVASRCNWPIWRNWPIWHFSVMITTRAPLSDASRIEDDWRA